MKNLWKKLKALFSRKPTVNRQIHTLGVKYLDLKLEQEDHSEILVHLLDKAKKLEEAERVYKNATANLDERLDQLENVTGFLYKKAGDQEARLSTLEDSQASDELTLFAERSSQSHDEN